MGLIKNIINKMAKNKAEADENANEHDETATTETVEVKEGKKCIKDAGAKDIKYQSPKDKEVKDDRFN